MTQISVNEFNAIKPKGAICKVAGADHVVINPDAGLYFNIVTGKRCTLAGAMTCEYDPTRQDYRVGAVLRYQGKPARVLDVILSGLVISRDITVSTQTDTTPVEIIRWDDLDAVGYITPLQQALAILAARRAGQSAAESAYDEFIEAHPEYKSLAAARAETRKATKRQEDVARARALHEWMQGNDAEIAGVKIQAKRQEWQFNPAKAVAYVTEHAPHLMSADDPFTIKLDRVKFKKYLETLPADELAKMNAVKVDAPAATLPGKLALDDIMG